MTKEEYTKQFDSGRNGQTKYKEALKNSLEIRRFEIELYWKRATYFWTFIAAILAAYMTVQQISNPDTKKELSYLLTCLGLVFSIAWYLVNRGSKFWQNNWERHVDLLEDKIIGPLYKTIIKEDNREKNIIKHLAVSTGEFSVTKINQILSLFMVLLWIILLIKSFYCSTFSIAMGLLSLFTIYTLCEWTTSSNKKTKLKITKRNLKIK